MKRIELINKIANDELEVGTKIKIDDTICVYEGKEHTSLRLLDNEDAGFYFESFKYLNDDDVEILKKDYKVIGKLTGDPSYDPNLSKRQHFINISRNMKLIQGKINEIIDAVNEINERR